MNQVCRTCLTLIENNAQLFSLEINTIHIKTKLAACVPEIGLNRVKNSVICHQCLYALNTAYEFKIKCLQTETKIFEYLTCDTIESTDLTRFISCTINARRCSNNAKSFQNNESCRFPQFMSLRPIFNKDKFASPMTVPPPFLEYNSVGRNENIPRPLLQNHSSVQPQVHQRNNYFQPITNPSMINSNMQQNNYIDSGPRNNLQNNFRECFGFPQKPLQCNPDYYKRFPSNFEPPVQGNNFTANFIRPAVGTFLSERNGRSNCIESRSNYGYNEPISKPSLFPQQSFLYDLLNDRPEVRTSVASNNNQNNFPVRQPIMEINHSNIESNVASDSVKNFSSVGNLPQMQANTNDTTLSNYSETRRSSLLQVSKESNLKNDEQLTINKVGCENNPENALKCMVCQQLFISDDLLKDHMVSHGIFKCSTCEFQTYSETILDEHKKDHLGAETSNSTQSEDLSLKKTAIKSPSVESCHQCSLCTYRSQNASSLRRHMKVHMGNRPFRCPQCRYGATSENLLQIHMKIHTKDKPHKCSDCSYMAFKRSKLRNHMLKNHNKILELSDIKYKSDVDPYQISLNDIHDILEEEDKTVVGQGKTEELQLDPYMVTVDDIEKILQKDDDEITDKKPCQSSVNNNNNKRVQMNPNKTLLKCRKCVFRTTIKSHYRVHMKLHNGGKVHKCENCEYSTLYWSNMEKHNRVHTGEKPFKCSYCDYKAVKKSSFENHMSTHTDESVSEGCNGDEDVYGDFNTFGNHFIGAVLNCANNDVEQNSLTGD